MNVALLERALLRRGGRPAGHAVVDHVIVGALKKRRGVAVIVGDDLLEHKVAVPNGLLVELDGDAPLFHVGRRGQHVALPVPARSRTDGRIHDVRPGDDLLEALRSAE